MAGRSRSSDGVALSVIIPAFNEEESVGHLHAALMTTLPALGKTFEIIFVDDGSSDGTGARLTELAAGDDRVRVIQLRRNYGQTPAMVAGIDHAKGDVLVTMDADLQNDPADIPRLLEQIDAGHDLVVGWRQNRQDKLSRRLPSIVANRLIALVTGVVVKDNGCTLKAYRAELIKRVPLYAELHRFIPAMASIPGCTLAEIEVRHHARQYGRSKYSMSRIWKVAIDIMVVKTLIVFARRPLFRFMSGATLAAALSMAYFLLALYQSLLVGGSVSAISMNVSVLFGSLAIFVGLMGMIGALVHQRFGSLELPGSGAAWGLPPSTSNPAGGAGWQMGRRPPPMLMERAEDAGAAGQAAPPEAPTGNGLLSVIVPVLDDGGAGVSDVHARYRAALDGCADAVEFIYVVGADNAAALPALTALKAAGEPMILVALDRMEDESVALRRGFRHARGAQVLTLPAKLQVDPSSLPEVLARLDQHDMVVGQRRAGGTDGTVDRVEASLFHWVIRGLFGRSYHDLVCRVRAYRRQVLEEIASYGVAQHFLPLVAADRGFRVGEVEVRGGPDGRAGSVGGPLRKMLVGLRLSLDALALFIVLRFIKRPLRFFGAVGLPILFAGLLFTGALAFARLAFGVPLGDRPALILAVLLIVLGIQIIAIGLIGEIIVFAAGRRNEDYTVERTL